MLQVIKRFGGVSAQDASAGDLNSFLQEVLVEVAAENYRQTMYEAMALSSAKAVQYDLDPPLRANERVMSGLFATAISRSALRSQSEVRVDRQEREVNANALEHDLEGDGSSTVKNGRVDYLAWYGSRVIGVELKMAGINCEAPKITQAISRRWTSAVNQAKTVQTCLRARQQEQPSRYPSPISIALMVLVGRRSVNMEQLDDLNEDGCVESMREDTLEVLGGLKPAPTFKAMYTFPREFRALAVRRKGRVSPNDDRVMFTPFVAFIAKPSVL
ncbi:hypothetical protein [Achromobacter mucicolens]|uniref:hypothetical protein n=1 Tax=Achromobacter mucicolens TaxID=1389922 RepID=UPI0039750FDB